MTAKDIAIIVLTSAVCALLVLVVGYLLGEHGSVNNIWPLVRK